MNFEGYRCSLCGAEFGPEGQRYLCPRDGGCLEVVLDLRRARREGRLYTGVQPTVRNGVPRPPGSPTGNSGR